jgi:hypothetical protein
MGEPRCKKCGDRMQQDLDSQGRLEWFCLNPYHNCTKDCRPEFDEHSEKCIKTVGQSV